MLRKLQIWYNPQTAQPYMLIQTIQDIFKDCKGPDCGWWWWWRQERGTKAKRVAKKNKTQAEEGGREARSERSWTKVRGGRGVMAREDGGGEKKKERGWKGEERREEKGEKNERARAWQWQSERARECEWKADRKGWIHVEHKRRQTLPPLPLHCTSVSLPLSIYFFLYLPPFFSPVSLCCSLLSLAFFKTISHYSLVPPAFLHHPVCVRGEYVRVKTS